MNEILAVLKDPTVSLVLIVAAFISLAVYYVYVKFRYKRDHWRACNVCADQNERIVSMYMCDPLLTDVERKIAIQLYTFTKIIVDEVVCVYAGVNDEKYKDYIKTADGIKRVDLVERGVRMLPDGQSEDFLRLITWK